MKIHKVESPIYLFAIFLFIFLRTFYFKFCENSAKTSVIDKIQKAPKLISEIKAVADNNNVPIAAPG